MLRSTRTTHIIHVARLFLVMGLDMDLDTYLCMTLDTATGVGIVPEIEVDRNAYPYLVACPNLNEAKSILNTGFNWNLWIHRDGVLYLHHGYCREEARNGNDQ